MIFLTILLVFIIFRRQIFSLLLLYLFKSLQKKAEKVAQEQPSPQPSKKSKSSTKDLGEYIDYEELN